MICFPVANINIKTDQLIIVFIIESSDNFDYH